MEVTNRYVVTKCRIDGAPNESDFSILEQLISLKQDSSNYVVIVKNLYVSIDPYQLNRMKTHSPSQKTISGASVVLPGQGIDALGVGEVVESELPEFKWGDVVSGLLSWGEYTLVKIGHSLRKLDTSMGFPLSYYAGGVLGSSGLIAYGGFFKVCKPKKGEKVFVSAASGSVGILVGQYVKLFGCYVVGAPEPKKRYFPEGIDIYFDNVGGEFLDAAVENMNAFGRVAVWSHRRR